MFIKYYNEFSDLPKLGMIGVLYTVGPIEKGMSDLYTTYTWSLLDNNYVKVDEFVIPTKGGD